MSCALHTNGLIISKSISKSSGRSSYRDLVKVKKGARAAKRKVVCGILILDSQSRSDKYQYIEVAEQKAAVGHEASGSRIGEKQLFYFMSRGSSESEASTSIVNAFLEPWSNSCPWNMASN